MKKSRKSRTCLQAAIDKTVDACRKAGLSLTPNCRQLINRLVEKVQPFWSGKDRDELEMEVIFAIARLPYVAPKIETKYLLRKVNGMDMKAIFDGFKSVVNPVKLKLTDRELLQLSLIYIDSYESPDEQR